ncbi:hypothetical protein Pmani_000775 [Petrolisthes manimaculis]|uniref:Uncharacterized protein n=1 Tax=Petrolisthes manimaculis TaxID=1843537 RepID=A0AAE1UKY6_9EUCA|nr:hypothetical protein Pmani_000775 [Petrolisthes manimaculis]
MGCERMSKLVARTKGVQAGKVQKIAVGSMTGCVGLVFGPEASVVAQGDVTGSGLEAGEGKGTREIRRGGDQTERGN